MESPKGRSRNYGWVVVGTFLAIDSMIRGITFSLGLMPPLISADLDMTLGPL